MLQQELVTFLKTNYKFWRVVYSERMISLSSMYKGNCSQIVSPLNQEFFRKNKNSKWAIPMFMKCLLDRTWQDFKSGRFVVGARKHLASYLWQLAVFCIYYWFIFIRNIGFSLRFLVDINGRATMRCTTILHLQH